MCSADHRCLGERPRNAARWQSASGQSVGGSSRSVASGGKRRRVSWGSVCARCATHPTGHQPLSQLGQRLVGVVDVDVIDVMEL
jgi:hypothetical protein